MTAALPPDDYDIEITQGRQLIDALVSGGLAVDEAHLVALMPTTERDRRVNACERCGKLFLHRTSSRRRRFCGTLCRVLAHRAGQNTDAPSVIPVPATVKSARATCRGCSASFIATPPGNPFCSLECEYGNVDIDDNVPPVDVHVYVLILEDMQRGHSGGRRAGGTKQRKGTASLKSSRAERFARTASKYDFLVRTSGR
jgi:hypothetical protein